MQRKLKGVSQYIKELEDVMVFQLEDRAYISLPKLLESDFGVRLKERLVRMAKMYILLVRLRLIYL